jgi:hypothetical protein
MRSSAIAIAIALALAGTANAEACEDDLGLSLFSSRVLVEPAPAGDALGVDLAARSIMVAWGRCHGLRHRIDVSAFEAPDFGDPDSRFLHFGG